MTYIAQRPTPTHRPPLIAHDRSPTTHRSLSITELPSQPDFVIIQYAWDHMREMTNLAAQLFDNAQVMVFS